ncbi:MAG: alpha/beta fold hydrolase, partial [Shewanella sp.]
REYMPHASVHEFADCGHYILEDASEQVIPLIVGFMAADLGSIASKEDVQHEHTEREAAPQVDTLADVDTPLPVAR